MRNIPLLLLVCLGKLGLKLHAGMGLCAELKLSLFCNLASLGYFMCPSHILALIIRNIAAFAGVVGQCIVNIL